MGEGDYLSRGAAGQRTADSGGCGVDAGSRESVRGLSSGSRQTVVGQKILGFSGMC